MKDNKTNLAITKAIADLTSKGYAVFIPTLKNLPFDLIAYNYDDEYYRIKAECSDGQIPSIKNKEEFDYFALYEVQSNTIVYPGVNFSGEFILFPNHYTTNAYYQYSDFLDLTDEATRLYLTTTTTTTGVVS